VIFGRHLSKRARRTQHDERGERDDAQAVSAGLGAKSLELAAAGARRVAVMGA